MNVQPKKSLHWYRVYWHKTVGVSNVIATSVDEAGKLAEEFCDTEELTEVKPGRIVKTEWHDPADNDPYIGSIDLIEEAERPGRTPAL